jgi:hypothetical protein
MEAQTRRSNEHECSGMISSPRDGALTPSLTVDHIEKIFIPDLISNPKYNAADPIIEHPIG